MAKEIMVGVEYLGNKVTAIDNITASGVVWHGKGDIQPMPDDKATKITAMHPTVWRLAEPVEKDNASTLEALKKLAAGAPPVVETPKPKGKGKGKNTPQAPADNFKD